MSDASPRSSEGLPPLHPSPVASTAGRDSQSVSKIDEPADRQVNFEEHSETLHRRDSSKGSVGSISEIFQNDGQARTEGRRESDAAISPVTAADDEEDQQPKGDQKTSPFYPRHKRVISWGENKSIFFDSAMHSNAVNEDLPSGVAAAAADPSSNFDFEPLSYQSRRFQAKDLKKRSPFEAEADAYLMRILDQKESGGGGPGSYDREAKPAPVMPHLPEEGVQSVLSAMVEEEHQSAAEGEDPQLERSTTEASARESTSTTSARPSMASQPSRRRMLQKQQSQKQPSRRHHRRTSTMEEKLFGLTAALDAMHTQDMADGFVDGAGMEQEPPRSRSNTVDSVNYSSGEALQQNANLLYQHHTKEYSIPAEADVPENTQKQEQQQEQDTSYQVQQYQMADEGIVMEAVQEEEEVVFDRDEEAGIDVPFILDDKLYGESNRSDKGSKPAPSSLQALRNRLKLESIVFNQFKASFSPLTKRKFALVRKLIMHVIIPSLGMSIVLYYWGGNPPTGVYGEESQVGDEDEPSEGVNIIEQTGASASWWLLFFGVRQVITFIMAYLFQVLFIDMFSMRTRIGLRVMGSWLTLFILQSRGWPFILTFWGLSDLGLLTGSHPFASHWLYMQSQFELFNASNPSGEIIESEWNLRIVLVAVCTGIIVSLKRFVMGLYLGRRTFEQYSDKLARIMEKTLLISEVGSLAARIERSIKASPSKRASVARVLEPGCAKLSQLLTNDVDDGSTGGEMRSRLSSEDPGNHGGNPGFVWEERNRVFDPDDRHPLTGQLSPEQKSRIADLLGAWEEPISMGRPEEHISVSAILQFRRAVALLDTPYPFGGSWGDAGTREDMIESSQEVFDRLMLQGTPSDDRLGFEVMASICLTRGNDLNQDKAKDLIRLFRPDRDGKINAIDFVKSVDRVYRKLRLLRASVRNSAKMDKAFESLFNVVFYGVYGVIVLIALGLDAESLFLTFSGVTLSFAFMISAASSKYFEGLIFILRDPYSIGDAIHTSNVEVDTSTTGNSWWRVEDVKLSTTTVVSFYTNERAMLTNASLANSRIINVSRSPPAGMYFLLKLPIDTPFRKLQILHRALEEYVRNRPREWLSFDGFRSTRSDAEKAYAEYIVVLTHRENWESFTTLMLSKSHVMTFALEVCQKLGIRYRAPPLPVDISVHADSVGALNATLAHELESQAAANNLDFAGLEQLFAPVDEGGDDDEEERI